MSEQRHRAQESPGPVVGAVEGLDLSAGVQGWVYDPSDRAQSLQVELWIGRTLLAVTAADRYRPDLGSEDEADFNPGFVFTAATLRRAAMMPMTDPNAKVEIRIKGAADALPGISMPSAAQLVELVEEDGVPARDTSGLDLRAALSALAEEAKLLRKRPLRPIADGTKGFIEHIALIDRHTVAFSGWIHRDVDLEQSAVILDGEKHEAAFSAAIYDRGDLPEYAAGVVGVVQTAWRPLPRGAEPFLFFGRQAEYHLRSAAPLKVEKVGDIEGPLQKASAMGSTPRLLELRQLLLSNEGWSARGDRGVALGVALSLDKLLLVPGFGAIVEGWVLEGARRISGMAIRVGSAVLDLDMASVRRSPRPDLVAGFAALKDGAPSAGFVGLFVGTLGPQDLIDPMFKVQFSDGLTVTVEVNSGSIQRFDSRFDATALHRPFPSLPDEPRFPQLVRARSEGIKRALASSVHTVIRTQADRLVIMTLPPSHSELAIVLENAARNFRRLPANTALALVAESSQDRSRILRWIKAIRATAPDAAISLTLVEKVVYAIYAVDPILKVHNADTFTFVGPHVWLTDEGWSVLSDSLDLVESGKDRTVSNGPAYLRVTTLGGEQPHDCIDAELFTWTRSAIQKWLKEALVSFDETARDRGLPPFVPQMEHPVAAIRLVSAARTGYKKLLDDALLGSQSAS